MIIHDHNFVAVARNTEFTTVRRDAIPTGLASNLWAGPDLLSKEAVTEDKELTPMPKEAQRRQLLKEIQLLKVKLAENDPKMLKEIKKVRDSPPKQTKKRKTHDEVQLLKVGSAKVSQDNDQVLKELTPMPKEAQRRQLLKEIQLLKVKLAENDPKMLKEIKKGRDSSPKHTKKRNTYEEVQLLKVGLAEVSQDNDQVLKELTPMPKEAQRRQLLKEIQLLKVKLAENDPKILKEIKKGRDSPPKHTKKRNTYEEVQLLKVGLAEVSQDNDQVLKELTPMPKEAQRRQLLEEIQLLKVKLAENDPKMLKEIKKGRDSPPKQTRKRKTYEEVQLLKVGLAEVSQDNDQVLKELTPMHKEAQRRQLLEQIQMLKVKLAENDPKMLKEITKGRDSPPKQVVAMATDETRNGDGSNNSCGTDLRSGCFPAETKQFSPVSRDVRRRHSPLDPPLKVKKRKIEEPTTGKTV